MAKQTKTTQTEPTTIAATATTGVLARAAESDEQLEIDHLTNVVTVDTTAVEVVTAAVATEVTVRMKANTSEPTWHNQSTSNVLKGSHVATAGVVDVNAASAHEARHAHAADLDVTAMTTQSQPSEHS